MSLALFSSELNVMARQAYISQDTEVRIPVDCVLLAGTLTTPPDPKGIVLFAHGSGSGRHSRRNQYVAHVLQEAGLATLLFDLLTEDEEAIDRYSAHFRFDISMLADRLIGATDWLAEEPHSSSLSVGYFGASTGGGAALVAAARRPTLVSAVVSRGGRPDLAGAALNAVRAPTLLIVGGDDEPVIGLNEQAVGQLGAPVKELTVIPGASHLFEEPGKLDEVAGLAADWFSRYLDLPAELKAD
jgi:dienelactone hydrolase